jgi:hypothetical protein
METILGKPVGVSRCDENRFLQFLVILVISSSGCSGTSAQSNAPSTVSTAASSAASTQTATPIGLTQDEAVAAARAAAPRSAEWSLLSAKSGRVGDRLVPVEAYPISPFPSDDRWVWVIELGTGQEPLGGFQSTVVLDFLDGHLYTVLKSIS